MCKAKRMDKENKKFNNSSKFDANFIHLSRPPFHPLALSLAQVLKSLPYSRPCYITIKNTFTFVV